METRNNRVLVLGPTGVDKGSALERLKAHASKNYGHELVTVDFEKAFLWRQFKRSQRAYLRNAPLSQSMIWKKAWDDFTRTLSDKPTLLSLHSTWVTSSGGVRPAIDLNCVVRDFRPDLIVTLIDDVYEMFRRTGERPGQYSRPKPEQLIMARRVEVFMGDLIASMEDYRARHLLLSTNHPIEVLLNLILFDAGVVYLSFPISEPRNQLANGKPQDVERINAFHRFMYGKRKDHPDIVSITPLAIDEIPFSRAAQAARTAQEENVAFNRKVSRWPLGELYGNADLLAADGADEHTVATNDASECIGLAETDVRWRDYRLVDQADALAVYGPIARGEELISDGVLKEMLRASEQGKVLYVIQPPEWDTKRKLKEMLTRVGIMGPSAVQECVQLYDTQEELFEALRKGLAVRSP